MSGYREMGDSLPDLFDVGKVQQTGHRIADNGGDRLLSATRRRTPVDTNPYRYRPGRPRGALKASLDRDGVQYEARPTGGAWVVHVSTPDPVAVLVEFDTRPHTIRAKAGGLLRFQSRYGWTDDKGVFHPPGSWVTVEEVRHPGTKGAHMFSLGALEVEATVETWSAAARMWLVRELSLR